MLDQHDKTVVAGDFELLTLGRGFDEYARAQAAFDADPHGTDAEQDRITEWGNGLLDAIAAAQASTTAGRAVKARALSILDERGGLTVERRMDAAQSLAERLAWSLVRDAQLVAYEAAR